jgi:hypothetical protein
MSEQVTGFKKTQFWVGFFLLLVMLGIHAFVKDLSIVVLAFPGLLMGVDYDKIAKILGRK